ncbi:unnamed protein product [Notodromas monacha]|uniref:PLAC domain-containing protein n=1 Tax=Notodromas monacha TaxID=399045 RepID=A0A7R9BSG0_9CRUS|nr:unnamed protein product [Notodromas monacha]CAG0920857.1 unnamed protein product [Notodromas monacha]
MKEEPRIFDAGKGIIGSGRESSSPRLSNGSGVTDGASGHPGAPAPNPVEVVSRPSGGSASLNKSQVQATGKRESSSPRLSNGSGVTDGASGHPGAPAPNPVEVVSRPSGGSASLNKSQVQATGKRIRHRDKFTKSKKKRGKSGGSNLLCSGVSERYHLCNDQKCSGVQVDQLAEECSAFNNKSFGRGHFYTWEPFEKAGAPCELNCRPIGQRFVATRSRTVGDGLPCDPKEPAAEPAGRHVCIKGKCTPVSCEGVIGKKREPCFPKRPLTLVSELFARNDMGVGTHLVTTIPAGAKYVNVSHVKPSANRIGFRLPSGTTIAGGSKYTWRPHRQDTEFARVAGMQFSFRVPDDPRREPGSAGIRGPLTQPVQVVLITREWNQGISYRFFEQPPDENDDEEKHAWQNEVDQRREIESYSSVSATLPKTIPLRSERKSWSHYDWNMKRNYVHTQNQQRVIWKLFGFNNCSASCGGGFLDAVARCVDTANNDREISEAYCLKLPKPSPQKLPCNTDIPCPAKWMLGDWGECSKPCDSGVQERTWECKQRMTSMVIVNRPDHACNTRKPGSTLRACLLRHCDAWVVGPWSECSASCGDGFKTREVTCGFGGNTNDSTGSWTAVCNMETRPEDTTNCSENACSSDRFVTLAHQEFVDNIKGWFVSDWDDSACTQPTSCQNDQKGAFRKRQVKCFGGDCDPEWKPKEETHCANTVSNISCSETQSSEKEFLWVTGTWTECSARCGGGKRHRRVFCAEINSSSGQIIGPGETNCPVVDRPHNEEKCGLEHCAPRWFAEEKIDCSCESRKRERTAVCFDDEHGIVLDSQCPQEKKPRNSTDCSPEEMSHFGCLMNSHVVADEPFVAENSSPRSTQNFAARAEEEAIFHPVVERLIANEDLGNEDSIRNTQPGIRTSSSILTSTSTTSTAVPNEDDDYSGNACEDTARNCYMIYQARLCKYQVFKSGCCATCGL